MTSSPNTTAVPDAAAIAAMLAGASQELNQTIGAFTLGTFVSLILYGISALQLYRYARLYPADNPSIKTLVAFVMLLETLHAILPMHVCYYYLVTNYSKPAVAQNGVWSGDLIPVVAGVIILAAQAFFARRVYLIGSTYRLVAAVAILALIANFGLGIYITYQAFQLPSLEGFAYGTRHATWASLLLTAGADFLLSGAIIVALRANRNNGHQMEGATKLEIVTLYVLNTGLLTGLVHGLSAILAITRPKAFDWAATSMVALRMYGVTLFAVLNSRKLLISRGIEIFDTDMAVKQGIFARANRLAAVEQWNVPRVPEEPPQIIHIKVAAETERDRTSKWGNKEFQLRELSSSSANSV